MTTSHDLLERDAALIEKNQEYKEDNSSVQELEQDNIQYKKSVEERRRKKKITVSG